MFEDFCEGKIATYDSLLLHVDGGCEVRNPGGVATSAWAIYDANSSTLLVHQALVVQDGGKLATNNYGEYCALKGVLKYLTSQNWHGSLTIKSDSNLLVEQVSGRWKVKAPHLIMLRADIWGLMDQLDLQRITALDPLPDEGKYGCSLLWIPREQNAYADGLCHLAYNEYRTRK